MPDIRLNRRHEINFMKDATLLKAGNIGTVITALCCFTPILVVLFGMVGLSAWLGWLDYVLFPALAIFIAMAVYAVWRRRSIT